MIPASSGPKRLRGLPGPVLAVLHVGLIALPLALAATSGLAPADRWAEAATAAGIAGGVMMLLQFASSGRLRGLSDRIGIDVTMGFHKWAGPFALVLVLLHPILLAGPITADDPWQAARRLWQMLSAPGLWEGTAALGLLVLMVLTSVSRDRLPISYESWRALHVILALLLVVLTILHVLDAGFYASEGLSRLFWPALGGAVLVPMLSVWSRKWLSHRLHDWRVAGNRMVGHKLWELTLEAGTGRPLQFRAGQFGWLGAIRKPIPDWFDHPFSFASGTQDGTRLRFIIQEAGDFTDTIGALPQGEPVGLDAPHGNFTLEKFDTDAILLVAGGVGIAPIVGLLEEMAARGERRPVRLLYGVRSPDALLSADLLDPFLSQLNARVTRVADTPGNTPGLEPGPIGRSHLQVALEGLDAERCTALVCGPGGMTTAVTDALYGLGMPLGQIHYERFDFRSHAKSVKDRQMLNRFRLAGLAIAAAMVAFTLR